MFPAIHRSIHPNKMIGYKAAASKGTRVIVTLEIPADALTNIARSSVVVKETAKYRANKAKVLAIEDEKGVSYESATSSHYDKKHIVYKVGETVEEPSYDTDIEVICGEGIHYFLTRQVADLYCNWYFQNGQYVTWHDNGQKREEVTCVDGKRHGLYQSWHDNGQKHEEVTFVDNKEQGLYKIWDKNGHKAMEAMYVDGEKHGLHIEWYENGQKLLEAMFTNGVIEDTYKSWFENEQKEMVLIYLDGKILQECIDRYDDNYNVT